MQRPHDICTVDGCDRKHHARGLCGTHYLSFKRGATTFAPIKARERNKQPECTEEGCHEPVKAKGLCKTHYQRFLRYGHLRRPIRSKPPRECLIETCCNHVYAKDLCHAHYIKQRKWSAYGVDARRYQQMLVEQNGVCAVCGQQERHADGLTGKQKDLAVDHCHDTGAVRALLCSACNTAIGLFNDDPKLLGAAKEYLAKHGRV